MKLKFNKYTQYYNPHTKKYSDGFIINADDETRRAGFKLMYPEGRKLEYRHVVKKYCYPKTPNPRFYKHVWTTGLQVDISPRNTPVLDNGYVLEYPDEWHEID